MNIDELLALEPFTPDADQSAEIKQFLKKEPMTVQHVLLANQHSTEAEEAASEVECGLDDAHPQSWAAVTVREEWLP